MNSVNPKVTVRMSAYNHEAYVEQAIRSILDQTFQDFELIVLDDGSSDRTPEILEELSQKHGFRFERQRNQGIAKSYNRLIGMARGAYITGCASDDYWPPTRLAEQVALLDTKPNVDMVHGRAAIVKNGHVQPKTPSNRPFVHGRGEFRPFLRRKRRFFTGSKMVRASSFERVGLYREDFAVEDFEWWLRATQRLNIHFEDKVWLFYRHHPNNFTKVPATARAWCDDYYTVCRELGVWDGLRCFIGGLGGLIRCENIARRWRRFGYYALLPAALVSRSIRRAFGRSMVDECKALSRIFNGSHPLIDRDSSNVSCR